MVHAESATPLGDAVTVYVNVAVPSSPTVRTVASTFLSIVHA
jgi:hypothetical protein